MPGERAFAFVISGVHGMDHLLKRLFPPLIPLWGALYGFPLWQMGLVLGALSFGGAVGQAPFGVASDRYDRRYILPAGIGLSGLGVLVFSLTPGIQLGTVALFGTELSSVILAMTFATFTIGIGSSTVHPTGYPLITANVAPSRKGRVLGMWGGASKFGDGVAPALVGGLTLVFAWHSVVAAFGFIGVLYALFLYVMLGNFETRPTGSRLGEDSASSQNTLENIPRRTYLYPLAFVFVYFVVHLMATEGVSVFLPEFISSVYGYSLTVAGFELTPASTASFYYATLLITAGAAQIGVGRLVDQYDSRHLLLGLMGVSAVMLAFISVVRLTPLALLASLLVVGIGLWGVNPARDEIVSDISPEVLEGRVFGYVWTGALLAMSVAAPAIGYIGDTFGIQRAFLILAGVVLLAMVPVLLLPYTETPAGRADPATHTD